MLNICTFWWGDKYSLEYVQKLAVGLRRNITQEYRFSVFTDKGFFNAQYVDDILHIPEVDKPLCTRGCFVRLRLFDPQWQQRYNFSDRIVSIDLDSVITGPLDYLFDRPEPFVILQGGNSSNPNPYGGALQMLRVGAYLEVWTDFSLEAAAKVPHADFTDDQAWIYAKIPNAACWMVGIESGVYCFQKPGWPLGSNLPKGARFVTFRGNNLPIKYTHLDWVHDHWRL